jgi:pimeloyl-ACP methyl ester carboxylesterase
VVHAECDTTAGLVEAGRSFGAATHIPSLWIYARDDEFFPPEVSQPFFDAFHAGQPLSTLKLYDHGGHAIAATGVNAWRADVVRFLRQTGLPAEMRGAGREPR